LRLTLHRRLWRFIQKITRFYTNRKMRPVFKVGDKVVVSNWACTFGQRGHGHTQVRFQDTGLRKCYFPPCSKDGHHINLHDIRTVFTVKAIICDESWSNFPIYYLISGRDKFVEIKQSGIMSAVITIKLSNYIFNYGKEI